MVYIQGKKREVQDPNFEYIYLKKIWDRIRVVLRGLRATRAYDEDPNQEKGNILTPFSPSMTREQYNWYKEESEMGGFVNQFIKTIISGLLRKDPVIELPEGMTQPQKEEAMDWLRNKFTKDDNTLISFLYHALWEEMNTSRTFVMVNYPTEYNMNFASIKVNSSSGIGGGIDKELPSPYPIILKAEQVINWRVGNHPVLQKECLLKLFVRIDVEENDPENEFHPVVKNKIFLHEIDNQGYYQIRIYESDLYEHDLGNFFNDFQGSDLFYGDHNEYEEKGTTSYQLVETEKDIMIAGKRLTYIPIYPLGESINPSEPFILPLIEREIGLYNKLSRRNHLLYGATTYTPIIKTDMKDEDQKAIVESGLGSMWFIDRDDDVDVLQTPSDALKDLEISIEKTIDEMTKLGMRMLAPDTLESGIALEIRNAGQTAQLSTIAKRLSKAMRSIVRLMVNWKYGQDYREEDFVFELSDDLTPVPIGEQYMRLIGEWYVAGIIPRSAWLSTIKANDLISADYNDEEGIKEIESDPILKKLEEMKQSVGDVQSGVDNRSKGAYGGKGQGSEKKDNEKGGTEKKDNEKKATEKRTS